MSDDNNNARQQQWMLTALRLFGRLPLGFVTRFGAFGAWLISWLPLGMAGAYRVALVNILLCYPELSYRDAARRARRALTETGRTLAEFTHVWTRPPAETLRRVHAVKGMEALRDAYASDRPVLLLTLHQSSWEIPNLLLGPEGPMTVFYQTSASDAFNDVVTRAREGTGSTLVPADARGIKAAIAAMGRNEAVAILVDHTPHGSNNPWVPFFGHPVRTSNLPYKLISRYHPHVFFVGCHRRNGPNDIEVYIEPAGEAIHSADEHTCLAAMNDGLATLISRYPDQYHWVYKRLRHSHGRKRQFYRADVVPYLRDARRRNGTLKVDELP